MTTTLKLLYERLVNQRMEREEIEGIESVKYWYGQHKYLFGKLKRIRNLIKTGNHSWGENEEFLEELLYKKNNGIASCGQSMLSKEQFHSFIGSDNFMSALTELILNPTDITLQRFEKIWKEEKGSNNLIRILRTAAASTTEVSTTVDIQKFNPLFDWLIREKMIEQYHPDDSHYTESQQWFRKNLFLMKEIKQQFQDELKSGTTDEIFLSHFVWYLYKYSESFHLKK